MSFISINGVNKRNYNIVVADSGGAGPPPVGQFNVLNSSAVNFAVTQNVLNGAGVSFAVGGVVLNSAGVPFNPV
ncbi:MAG: hypothetical protein ACOYBQ_10315 [Fluviibacter sp.]